MIRDGTYLEEEVLYGCIDLHAKKRPSMVCLDMHAMRYNDCTLGNFILIFHDFYDHRSFVKVLVHISINEHHSASFGV
jgi:hypothetical protein